VLQLWPAGESVTVVEDGLVLREWTTEDVPDLVRLFDTPEMDRRTPLTSPFNASAARLYVQAAHHIRRRLEPCSSPSHRTGGSPKSAAARGRSCTWRSGSALSSQLLPGSRLLFAGATTTTRRQTEIRQ